MTTNTDLGTAKAAPPKLHTASVVQLAFSLLAITAVWGASGSLAMVGLIQRFSTTPGSPGAVPFLLMSASTAMVGLLLLPSATYALLRLTGRAPTKSVRVSGWLLPLAGILTLPLVLLAGDWIAKQPDINWLLLPPVHVLAIGLPVFVLAFLGLRGISLGSPQRVWGIIAAGSFLSPALIFAAEALALGALLLMAVIWLSTRPDLMSELVMLVERLEGAEFSPQVVQQVILPYLAKPGVVLAALAFGAVIIPLIEELIKPIGAWLMVGSQLSPAAGFAVGVLSGAGYALVESLGLVNTGEEWTTLVLARMGTAGVHILTAGLSGWALTLAWRRGQYLLLGVVYLINVGIHGVWNALSLATVFASLPRPDAANATLSALERLGEIAPASLMGLAGLAIVALLVVNWLFSHSRDQEAPEVPGVV